MRKFTRGGKLRSAVIAIALAVIAGTAFWFFHSRAGRTAVFPGANVLLITIDTIRPDHLSPYGSSNKTPNIAKLAARGILYENAFCQVPLTFPSHVSILTGLYPVRHGVHQNGIEIFTKPDALVTSVFRSNGYRTGSAVSSFVLDRKFGLAAGFDVYDDKMERLPTITTNFEVERTADQTVAAAIRTLENWRNDKWFFWVHFYDPHTPYNPPSPAQGYSGEIEFVDEQIGKLLQWLNERQLSEKTVIALIGDHAESLGQHGEKTHGFFVYNSTLKIPLIVSYPKAVEKRITTPVASVDVAATLLELVRIDDPYSRDGHSLLSNEPRKTNIYFESRYAELLGWNGLQGLIQGNWKLISTTRSELYELSSDPKETRNLFSAKQDISGPLKNDLNRLESTQATSTGVDAETAEKLRSLGYIGSASLQQKIRTADPKDKIALWTRYEESLEAGESTKRKTELLESLVKQEPSNNFFLLALATHHRQERDFEIAAKHLKDAIENDASDATAYHELAVTLKEMREYDEALRAEEAAIALQPQRSEFRGVRGMIWVETGQFQKAEAEFKQVLQMDPNNATAWNNLGNAQRALNQLEEAKKSYARAIDLSPHYAYPHNGIATVLVNQNRARDAIPYFEKAMKLDPKFFEVYLNLAIAFHSLQQTEQAKSLYLTFLKIAPDWMAQEKANARTLLSQLR